MTGRLALMLLAVSMIAGCGSGTWPKTAGQTTCAEWIDEMTVDQRKGLAEAILVILWDKDGAAEVPPEEKVLLFANGIGGVCGSYRDEMVNKIGSGLYVLSNDVKP